TTAEMSFGFMSYIDDSGETHSMFGGGRGEGRRGEGRRGGRGGFNIGEMIKRFDANGDGMLQESEAPDRIKQFFSMIDANSDGGITAEEAQTAFDRFGGG